MIQPATRFVDRAPSFRARQLKFQKSRKAEIDYARKLRSIAKQVGVIVNGFAPNGIVSNATALNDALHKYADMITPWARAVASRMLDDIKRRDEDMWKQMGDEIGRNLKKEIETAATGYKMAEALDQQVILITSLPLEAAQRVHDLTMVGLSDSTRASEIAKEIMRSGEVTKSRANLIARTEVARAATELTKARAIAVGVTHFTWHTAGDADVRESHRKLNNKIFEIENPPVVDGKPLLPGTTFNCRCYMAPIVSDDGE